MVENDREPRCAGICAQYPQLPVRYLQETTQGLSHARNAGWNAASGQIVLFFDDDIRVNPDTLAAYDEAFQTFGETSFYGGAVEPEYPDTPPPTWLEKHLPVSATGLYFSADQMTIEEPTFIGPNHAVPKALLSQIGGFDPVCATGSNAGGVGEEMRLQARLLAAGAPGRIVHRGVVHHYVPPDDCSPSWVIARRKRHGFTEGWEQATQQRKRPAPWMFRLLARHAVHRILNHLLFLDIEARFPTEIKSAYMSGYIRGLLKGRADVRNQM